MKISFNKPLNEIKGGSGTFIRRLVPHLENKGVRIVDFKRKPDIHINIIHGPHVKRAKNVQRIDGIYYDRKRMSMNNPIWKTYLSSDAVIFQSKWSQKMFHKMLGKKSKYETVIWNGADNSSFRGHKINKHGFDKVFLAGARWRPNKRLDAIVEAFLHAKKITDSNIGLFLIGADKIKNSSIINFGKIKNKEIFPIYASSDYFVHISHLESCSNSVVEALCCGLPVICNNIGGTPEIVNQSGIVVKIDKDFNFRPIKNMEEVGSKSVNTSVVSIAMKDILKKEWSVVRPDLESSNIAMEYMKVFKRILS